MRGRARGATGARGDLLLMAGSTVLALGLAALLLPARPAARWAQGGAANGGPMTGARRPAPGGLPLAPDAHTAPTDPARPPAEPLSSTPLAETTPPRGREAPRPTAIPLRGWRQIALRTFAAVEEDRVLAVAAGVTFYLVLAMVPAITAFVSIYGLFAARESLTGHIDLLSGLVPPEILPVVSEQLTRIATAGATTMTFASIFSLMVAAWSANGGTKALIEALNVAYDERETRSFVQLTLLSLALTAAGVVLGLGVIASVAVLPAVLSFLPYTTFFAELALWLRWPLLMLVMMAALAALYRFGPDRAAARWRWVSPGAVVAALALIPLSLGFSFYASRFADFNGTYGSLGALMGLLLWLWLVSVIVLMGAELNAEAEKQTNQDTTIGRNRPMGRRRARAADTVAR